MNLKGKHVLVLGMGETGMSLVKWLNRQEAKIRIADSRAMPLNLDAVMEWVPESEVFAGPFEDAVFEGVEVIAMSPGVPISESHVQSAIKHGIPVVGDIALFKNALEKCIDLTSPK